MSALDRQQRGAEDGAFAEGIVLDMCPAPASLAIRAFWPVGMCAAVAVGGVTMGLLDFWASVGLWAAGGAVAAGLGALVWASYERRATRYLLTTRRLAWHEGVISRSMAEAVLGRVQNVLVRKSFAERLFGLGTIAVATAGTDGYEIVWRHVANPDGVLRALWSAVDRWTPGVHPNFPNQLPKDGRRDEARSAGVRVADRAHNRGVIPVIGLAGGIGAGKSHVAPALEGLGCYVVDSDARARAALDREDVKSDLVRWWGERVLGPDGRVDRACIAQIIFADATERSRLEALVHPLVRQDRARLIAEAAGLWPKAIVVDAPLLFEAGVDKECDDVIFVDSPRAERFRRIRETRGWDEAEMERRESAQWPLERKRALSRFVVQNHDQSADLTQDLEAILSQILGPSTRESPRPSDGTPGPAA